MKTIPSISRAPGALPFIGHAAALMHDPLRFLMSLPAHGDLVMIRLGTEDTVMLCDPELTRRVLLDDRTFDKGGQQFIRARHILGGGLVTSAHDHHRRQRRLIQPAFTPARLPAYTRTMTAQVSETIAQWRDGDVIDVTNQAMELTMRTALETLFSGALPAKSLVRTLDDLAVFFAGFLRQTALPTWLIRLPTPANVRFQRTHIRLRETLAAVIATRRTDGADHGDLLSGLPPARDHDDQEQPGLTEAELQDQAFNFLLAGAETIAVTLAWALYLLARHPDVEERLHAEVDTVLAGAPARFEDLPDLPFTRNVVTETLRLYPPGWLLTRIVTDDTELGGHRLPAGQAVAYSPYLIHHRGDLYDQADHFDPDRWSSPHRTPPPRHAFIPFGAGPRKCIGDQFGTTEAVIALATIAARWRLRPLTNTPVRPAAAISLKPRELRMRLTART